MSVVWQDTVDDGAWLCTVTSEEDAYRGVLLVTAADTGEVILDRKVGIMYGAPFGPDFADVAEWEDLCIQAIDLYYEEHK